MSEFEQEKKNKNGALVGVLILLLLGLAVMAYLWSSKNAECNACENEKKELLADMEGMNQMMSGYVGDMSKDLKADLKNMLAAYDEMKLKNEADADSMARQQQEIQSLLEKVEKGKWTARELFRFQKENESLRRIMKGYVIKIDSLETSLVKVNTDLTNTRSELTQTSEQLSQTQESLNQAEGLVKKGSKLQAFNFASTGLRSKLNNTMTDTERARNCEQIKSSFTISENPIAQPGKKMVYMQIVTPEGKTLQSNSGNVLQTENGPVPYSDKKEIDYQNQRIDIAIFYRLNGEELSKGNYKVKIYCQGQLIGTDNFTLK
ncbi:MAG: hypothetical protein ACO2Z9_04805 [Crocinitomicaceae bacterium]